MKGKHGKRRRSVDSTPRASTVRPSKPPRARLPVDAAATPLRSEGQRLLLGVPGSLSEIAQSVGVRSKQTVAFWRKGEKQPDPEARRSLFAAYGIDPMAWSTPPNGGGAAVALAPGPPDVSHARTIDDCERLLKSIQGERAKPNLQPSERKQYADTEARVLALKHRMESDAQLLETRIVLEHPTWRRMRSAIVSALVPYPAAATAVANALAAVEAT